MAKLPSFQFYPGDWMKEPTLRSCSLAARGLWIDALCLMFEMPRRGYLQYANGKLVTDAQLARMVGCDSDEFSGALQELETAGVFSRTKDGVIFSRRMERDERIRQVRSEAGKQGGNPVLLKQSGGKVGLLKQNSSKTQANVQAKRKQNPTPSSSSSSSDLKKPPNPLEGESQPVSDDPPGDSDPPEMLAEGFFPDFWAKYPKSRHVDRKKCLAIWKRERLDHEHDVVMAGLDRWNRSDQWHRKIIPHPQNWLNKRYWEADPPRHEQGEFDLPEFNPVPVPADAPLHHYAEDGTLEVHYPDGRVEKAVESC